MPNIPVQGTRERASCRKKIAALKSSSRRQTPEKEVARRHRNILRPPDEHTTTAETVHNGNPGDGDLVGEDAVIEWTPSTGERRPGRRKGGIPSGVTVVTDTFPTRLSCGYCRKVFRIEVIDRHEERCSSRNPELFDTPCVACGFQGPRCACWALRNGLLREVSTDRQKPLFALFNKSRNNAAMNGDRRTTTTAAATGKAAVGFLGGWKAGEGLRRPAAFVEDAGEDNQAPREPAKELWRRERDEWLFGRTASSRPTSKPLPVGQSSTVNVPRAPICGPSDGGRRDGIEDLEGQDSGHADVTGEVMDEAFWVREREQMRSHFEKIRDAARVRQYTERWFKFSADPPDIIRYRDIPWLPRLSFLSSRGGGFGRSRRTGTLLADRDEEEPQERFETLGISEGDSLDVKKAALRAASLRWHPDKFMSKYGPKIAAEDLTKIVNDVQVTMQRITKLKERLQQAEAAPRVRT